MRRTGCRWPRPDGHPAPTSELHQYGAKHAGVFIPDQSRYLLDQGRGGQFVHRNTGGPQRQAITVPLRALALRRCGRSFRLGRPTPSRASHAITISDSHVYWARKDRVCWSGSRGARGVCERVKGRGHQRWGSNSSMRLLGLETSRCRRTPINRWRMYPAAPRWWPQG